MAQVAREKALTKFREDKLQVLVATDVAARGIDVAGVSHVINYTCPEDDKTYVHRIGRTGRAGASGIAITFVDWADLHRWKMINKTLDLPFDEPQETYSTSEHLFHDQGIPPGTKGRIVDPSSRGEPRSRRDGDRGARWPRRRASRRRRPARSRDRNRTRTRSGETVAAATAVAAAATAPSGAAGRRRRRGPAPARQPQPAPPPSVGLRRAARPPRPPDDAARPTSRASHRAEIARTRVPGDPAADVRR